MNLEVAARQDNFAHGLGFVILGNFTIETQVINFRDLLIGSRVTCNKIFHCFNNCRTAFLRGALNLCAGNSKSGRTDLKTVGKFTSQCCLKRNCTNPRKRI